MDQKPGPSKDNEQKTDPEKETESKENRQEGTESGSNPPQVLGSGSRSLDLSLGSASLQEQETASPDEASPTVQRSKARFTTLSSHSMMSHLSEDRSPNHDMSGAPLPATTSRGVFGRVAQKMTSRPDLSQLSLTKKKKKKINPAERKFISPLRAMEEYCLTSDDLQGLSTVQRRSPYRSAPRMTVYNRSDVEAKAIQIWGSKEEIEAEFQRRIAEKHAVALFPGKKKLREMRREDITKTDEKKNKGLCSRSGFVVLSAITVQEYKGNVSGLALVNTLKLTAIGVQLLLVAAIEIGTSNFLWNRPVLRPIRLLSANKIQEGAFAFRNALNLVFKLIAWLYTSSHSMFSETLHSVADTANQMILAVGIYKSTKTANPDHPYGYTGMRYVSSLISGVGIFCIGSGLSLYHGMVGLITDTPIEEFFWAYLILLFGVTSETLTLLFAVHAIHRDAKKTKMSMCEYVLRGVDPSVNVVLLEDSAAVTGVVVAAICMAISQNIHSGIPDSIGSLLVGLLLGWVAWFIIRSNVGTLIGKSIPYEKIVEINKFIEKDSMIRAIYDVKGIDMGNNLIKYKAELDFDGRVLTKAYLDKRNIQEILEEMKAVKTIEDAEIFVLKHGEQIVDKIGAEIDRIEVELRSDSDREQRRSRT